MPLRAIFSASTLGANLEGGGAVDEVLLHESLQAHGEVLHALRFAHANRVGELFVFFFEDQFSHRGIEGHDLDGGDAADVGFDGTEQFLRDDAAHVECHGAA